MTRGRDGGVHRDAAIRSRDARALAREIGAGQHRSVYADGPGPHQDRRDCDVSRRREDRRLRIVRLDRHTRLRAGEAAQANACGGSVGSPAISFPGSQTVNACVFQRSQWPTRAPIVAADGSLLAGSQSVVQIGLEPDRIAKSLPTIKKRMKSLVGTDPASIDAALHGPGVQPKYFVEIATVPGRRPVPHRAASPARTHSRRVLPRERCGARAAPGPSASNSSAPSVRSRRSASTNSARPTKSAISSGSAASSRCSRPGSPGARPRPS